MKIFIIFALFFSAYLLAQKPLSTIPLVQYTQMPLEQAKETAPSTEPAKKSEKAAVAKASEKGQLGITINSMQGIKVQIVKIEEIDTIGHV
jgi:hypothetical protein